MGLHYARKKEDPDSLKQYLEWLKAIFKDKPYVALAYMTGILPIKSMVLIVH